MIIFNKVKLHNFLSYKEAELNLNNQGVTLIEGINNSNDAYTSSGSGKSSLLSSITYALYGKTVTGITSNAVINKEAKTDCYVELSFSINESNYCIKRYRKGKHNNGNKVRLYLNDKEITEATNQKTDKAIQDLIGVEFNTYINTISYGSSDEPIFSQATDRGKKEILENLANTTVYSKAREYAKDKLKGYKVELESNQEQKQNVLTMIKQYKELKENADKDYQKSIMTQRANIEKLEHLKQDRDTYTNASEKRLKELNIALDSLIDEEPTSQLDSELTNQLNIVNKISLVSSKLTSTKQQELREIKKLRTQYKNINSLEVCPTCGHKLDSKHKKEELDILSKKGLTYKTNITNLDNKLNRLSSIYTIQKNKLIALQKKVSSYNKAYKTYQDNVNNVKQQIQAIELKKQEYNLKITTLEHNTQLETPKPKCYNNYIKIEESKLKKTDNTINELTKNIYTYSLLANKVFSKEGITSVVLDLITPYLNEHANYYLNKLSGSILTINMNTQTLNANKTLVDKFDIKVVNQAGADSYKNCSAGERKRIDIAIAFAIQDLQQEHSNTATNIAIYDECFDGLDSVGCESVIDILKEKSKHISSIFVITHNDTLKPLFDNSIKIIKNKQGISTIGE
jgi:DNA repair exonuclease SbcCD ATPase subunit